MAVSHKEQATIADFRFFLNKSGKNQEEYWGPQVKTEDLHMEIIRFPDHKTVAKRLLNGSDFRKAAYCNCKLENPCLTASRRQGTRVSRMKILRPNP